MNSYLRDEWAWIEGIHGMRDGLLERLGDDDLAFTPGGDAPSLGELIREHEAVQRSYVEALRAFRLAWAEPATGADLADLITRFHIHDADLRTAVEALDDDDLARSVTREDGAELPVRMVLDVYVQAGLIFAAKASVYLKAMARPLPPSVAEFIW